MVPNETDELDVAIREMRPDDLDAVTALWLDAGLPYKPAGRDAREELLRQMRAPTACYLVAEWGGEVVGTVLGTHDGRKGWINRVAVDRRLRRRGVARLLVGEVEKRFIALGLGIFACLIEDWNEVSARTFGRLGYERVDEIKYFVKRLRPGV